MTDSSRIREQAEAPGELAGAVPLPGSADTRLKIETPRHKPRGFVRDSRTG